MSTADQLLADLETVLAGGQIAAVTRADDDLQVRKLRASLSPEIYVRASDPVDRDGDVPGPTLRSMLDELAASDPERLPWPADWTTRREPCDFTACRLLWGSVLLECLRTIIREAVAGWKARPAPTVSVGRVRGQRSEWRVPVTCLGTRDFHMVCALAGLDGVAVEERFDVALQSEAGTAALAAALFPKGNRWDEKTEEGE